MKTVIIGGVAAGTKVGAKLKRECPNAEVVIYTKSSDISYAGCGLPYYVGGDIKTRQDLIVNTPQKFTDLTGVVVHTNREVTNVDTNKNVIIVNNENINYDNLVIASGASAFIPPIEGTTLNGVFTVREPNDAIEMREYAKKCKSAVVVGGGFIGLEVAENLIKQGLDVTLIDMAEQLMPNIFDFDMAELIKRRLIKSGLKISTNTGIKSINGNDCVSNIETTNGIISADLVVLSIGIRPNTKFLENSDIKLERGLVLTDKFGKTNIENIYAVGDCAMVRNRITGNNQWSAMGSTANIVGRLIGLTISGEKSEYKGCLGTGVIKLSENLNAARSGLTEKQAIDNGYDTICATMVTDDKAHYYPGADEFIIKLIADKTSHKLLGVQVIGSGAVDKIADIAVVGLSAGLRVEDFITMDFSYAPPFSTAIHPIANACGVLYNKIQGKLNSITPYEFLTSDLSSYKFIDAHPTPEIKGLEWIDINNLNEFNKKHDKNEKLLLICTRGKKAYMTQNKLKAIGYVNTKVLEGGITVNKI